MTQPPLDQNLDWDAVYRRGIAPPWSIGEPQPELAALITDGKVRGPVLDAGCGHAELALALARQGYPVVGLDFSETAVAAATATAAARGLTTATFAQADVTDFGGYDGRFATVLDSGLFHSLPVDRRPDYLRCIARAAADDAVLYILAFSTEVTGDHDGPGPRGVAEDEFRALVSVDWAVDELRPAFLYGKATGLPPEANGNAMGRFINGDRMRMPGFLLRAHKKR